MRCPPLDANSTYAYLLLCHHFPRTCAIALRGRSTIGFLAAYHPPADPDALFVWQVAVDESARGEGIGLRLIEDVLGRDTRGDIRYVEATVNPSNAASSRLFGRLADRLAAPLHRRRLFDSALFEVNPPAPPGATAATHEPEDLLRIGPFDLSHLIPHPMTGATALP